MTLTGTAPQAARDEHLLGQYIPLVYHYNMLQDEERVNAFQAAINYVVQPGMHVVELGAGTGILSSFAARRGAKVTCVERIPDLAKTAQRLLTQNSLSDQVTVIQADAAEFTPDQPVDVVVCEMLHVGLLREKQAQVIAAFKQNYQRAFGSTLPLFIPEVSILMVQPVTQSFDFAGYYAPVPTFHAPIAEQPRTSELAPLAAYANIAYSETIPMRFDFRMEMTTNRQGPVNALRFVTQNVLAVDMTKQEAITWANQCMVLPIETPLDADSGQALELRFDYEAGGSVESLAESLDVKLLPTQHAIE